MDGAHRPQRVNVSAATGFGHPPRQPQGAAMTGPLALPDLAAHADAAAIYLARGDRRRPGGGKPATRRRVVSIRSDIHLGEIA
jgi:hypothetical protein